MVEALEVSEPEAPIVLLNNEPSDMKPNLAPFVKSETHLANAWPVPSKQQELLDNHREYFNEKVSIEEFDKSLDLD